MGDFGRMAELSSIDHLISILYKCRKTKILADVKRVHAHICSNGMESREAVGNCIVPMFVECESTSDAQKVFNKSVHRDLHSWTSLILGYIECGQSKHALKMYQKMQEDSVQPSSYMLTTLLKACARVKDVETGRGIHLEIARKGFEKDVFVGSSLVDVYGKCGSLAEAQEVFDKLPIRNVVSWTALIAGYAGHGPGQEALKCFEQMQLEGITPDAVTFVCVLKACGNIGAIEKGRKINLEITEKGLDGDLFLGSALVDMYARCGSLAEARTTFHGLPVRNVASWNALIAGFVEHRACQEALKCFQQMQLEGISPNAVTFVCILKYCGSIGDIEMGRHLHSHVARKGFERDIFLLNTLVDMYAKCGSLAEAQEVFALLPVRNVVSWTALIAGYAEHGSGREALECFERMQLEGISPNAVTFVCILKACGSIGAIDKGREIHMHITQRGFEGDVLICNTLIDMYAKCGSLVEAWELFDSLPCQDVVSWNTLIAGYAEHGPFQEALKCFEQMQLDDVSPNAVTFVCVLKACGSIGAIDKCREIHADIAQKYLETDVFIGNALVDMYVKCGSLAEAREVFDKLQVRNVVSWNALIAGYAEHGPCQEALNCFEQMPLEDISPDAVTCVGILKACGSIGAIEKGRDMHAYIRQKGFEEDVFVGSTLVDMYAKCGSQVEAWGVFDKLPIRNVVSWNALIAGYAEHGPAQEVLKCFERMQVEGVSPDAVTFVCVLKACSSTGAIDKGWEIHADIARKGFERNVFVGSALVDMYTKCGSVVVAQEIFDKLPVRNVVSWNALIAGYAEHGPGQEALKCFEEMQLEGITPDPVTLVCTLKACGSIGAIDQGREIHTYIKQNGFESDLYVGNTLVDMYAKCGSLSEAQEVFDKLPVRDVVSWNAMIKGYGLNHEGKIALQFFEKMKEQGLKPDDITFICLLSACSRARLVFKGQEFFNLMREEYGIAPTIDHYTCMVDLLGKSGYLYEAEKFLKTVPCSPLWAPLLTACKVYGEAELGLRCFQQLVQIYPEYAAPYVLMAKIYANVGSLDAASRIEELRKHAGAKKKPASAWIEVNRDMHEFVVGDIQTKEISARLEILSSRMQEEGHVPDIKLVLRPSSNEEKKAVLCEQAE